MEKQGFGVSAFLLSDREKGSTQSSISLKKGEVKQAIKLVSYYHILLEMLTQPPNSPVKLIHDSADTLKSEATENGVVVVDLQENAANWAEVVKEVAKLETNIFPGYESLFTYTEEQLRHKKSELLYVEVDGEIVGYVMYSSPPSLSVTILELAVKESCRRRGYGEALLKAAISKCRARNVKRVLLQVDPLRISAMELYKKLGFQVDTFIKGFYSTGQDAYAMYLEFDSD
ncbi:hypothetical protein HS088_TW06G00131 [Tripterygium wilfordii]|uniref:N-acetyltransferase domain-containing protein n=1 Tax=Tripterygium wilfordii TaxID=458696 RepID=A0A7J7DIT3_TRIWF|nr:uncharacterized protein LOC120000469 [Tripterygium wilfordii]KAF5745966.1 hypothetical protein HS088_TW06G00131 [Tripterygium wilfordii]